MPAKAKPRRTLSPKEPPSAVPRRQGPAGAAPPPQASEPAPAAPQTSPPSPPAITTDTVLLFAQMGETATARVLLMRAAARRPRRHRPASTWRPRTVTALAAFVVAAALLVGGRAAVQMADGVGKRAQDLARTLAPTLPRAADPPPAATAPRSPSRPAGGGDTRIATPPIRRPDAVPKPSSTRWTHLTGLMRQGLTLYREGWYGPATARFREAARVMPDYARAYLWLGRSGLKAGRIREARRALQQVVALAPGTPTAAEARRLLDRMSHGSVQ